MLTAKPGDPIGPWDPCEPGGPGIPTGPGNPVPPNRKEKTIIIYISILCDKLIKQYFELNYFTRYDFFDEKLKMCQIFLNNTKLIFF